MKCKLTRLAGMLAVCAGLLLVLAGCLGPLQGFQGGGYKPVASLVGWEDLRIDGLNTRAGSVAPTDETGFRGSSAFSARNLVHNQADEVQFDVQMPHSWDNTDVWPHVHFSPWITNTGTVTVSFVLNCYDAAINGTFPSASTLYTMTKSWTGNGQWNHYLAARATAYTGLTGKGLSAVQKCRLYRDNTVTGNLAGKVTLLYFDTHYRTNRIGSNQPASD